MRRFQIYFKYFLIFCLFFSCNFYQSQFKKIVKRKHVINNYIGIISKNDFQLETTFYYEDNQQNADNFYLPENRLRYGLFRDFEVFADIWGSYNPGNGFGILPISLGFKTNLYRETKYIPDINLLASVQTKNWGSKKFANAYTFPEATLIFQKDFTKKFSSELDFTAQRQDKNFYSTIFDLSFQYDFTPKYSLNLGLN